MSGSKRWTRTCGLCGKEGRFSYYHVNTSEQFVHDVCGNCAHPRGTTSSVSVFKRNAPDAKARPESDLEVCDLHGRGHLYLEEMERDASPGLGEAS